MEKKSTKKAIFIAGGTTLATAALIAGATASFADNASLPSASASSSTSATQQGKGQHTKYTASASAIKTMIDQVSAKYPNAQISDFHAEANNTFRIEIVDNGTETHLKVAADGTITVDTNVGQGHHGGKHGDNQGNSSTSGSESSTPGSSSFPSSTSSSRSSATSNS